MPIEENKQLVRAVIEEALNKGNVDVADEYFSPDYVAHIPRAPETPPGPMKFKLVIAMWRTAFEDWHMTIEDLIAEGDYVVNRFTTRGTHTGPLMGIPPTGRKIEVRGIEMHRIVDGKVVESWIADDIPSILVQLGVLEMPRMQAPRPAAPAQ